MEKIVKILNESFDKHNLTTTRERMAFTLGYLGGYVEDSNDLTAKDLVKIIGTIFYKGI